MIVKAKEVTIGDIARGYSDNGEAGVRGYDGRLDIRPAYQREFVYSPTQRDAVITSVNKKFPLGGMYWGERADGNFEIIDGQQRTVSLCQYVTGAFTVNGRAFYNLTQEEQATLLSYKLNVYACTGSERDKLDWFETINIAGSPLTKQELRNATYAGPWLEDAKRYFSRNGCPAYAIGETYMTGTPIRQDYLETVLRWYARKRDFDSIEAFMAVNQHRESAVRLWQYFQSVISWATTMFNQDENNRRELRYVDWGLLYDEYADGDTTPERLKLVVDVLMADDEVTNKRGIYQFALGGDEKYLNLRAFTPSQKRTMFERQHGICPLCEAEGVVKTYELGQMEADHITPWCEGGKTDLSNGRMLCRDHNRRKGAR